jgi:hypothetical protein
MPKARKNYAGTAPITRASGKSRIVLARFARNRRLADALYPVGVQRSTELTRRPCPSTTPSAQKEPPTTPRSGPWRTASSAFSTAAYVTAPTRAPPGRDST